MLIYMAGWRQEDSKVVFKWSLRFLNWSSKAQANSLKASVSFRGISAKIME